MELSGRRWNSDKRPIIIDIGTRYCKIGFIGECAPMNIISTSLNSFKEIQDSEELKVDTLKKLCDSTSVLDKEVEELIYEICYTYLQLAPKEKPVILCYSLMTPFSLVQAFSKVLFNVYNSSEIFYFLNNILPIYTSAENTGLIIDCGFNSTQVLGIIKGQTSKATFKVANIGGFTTKNAVLKVLKEDNPGSQFTCRMIEDMIARYGVILTVAQKQKFLEKENIEKMKAKKYLIDIQGASFTISYYTRICCGESLFGNIHEEEENIAYTILSSIMNAPLNLKAILLSKMIISGGVCMIPGFKRRLIEELKMFLTQEEEFKEISCNI